MNNTIRRTAPIITLQAFSRDEEIMLMAGPSASVLLREPLNRAHIREMHAWLAEVATTVERHHGRRGAWDVWINGPAVGCSDSEPSCRLSISLEEPDSVVEWVESVDEALGYRPLQEISIGAGTNRTIDHCVLGRVALHFAQQFAAVVSMNGSITPPLPPGRHSALDDRPSHTASEVRAFLAGIPGQVWEIGTRRGRDDALVLPFHVVDAEFLENWLGRPDFHMVK